jgi:ABC-2 type transport system ATP-binding protein
MTQTHNGPFVELERLTKTFGTRKAVEDFTLTIRRGDCIGLIGPNGAGKTTLLKMVSGILQESRGSVRINGEMIEQQRALIGYLPQYPQFHEWMTAEEVLSFYGQLSGVKKTALQVRIQEVLGIVGLAESGKRKVGGFSGGMKQRLGIAQAIIHRPEFVILDEPVSALDPIGRREVLDLIRGINQSATVIFSTHILGDAQEICNRFCIMRMGKKLEDFYYSDWTTSKQTNALLIECRPVNQAWINHVQKMARVHVRDNAVQLEALEPDDAWVRRILSSLLEYHVEFVKMEVGKLSLEDYFIQLVGGKDE